MAVFMPSNEALRMFISSMRPAGISATAHATDSRSMIARSVSRLRADICFESFSSGW